MSQPNTDDLFKQLFNDAKRGRKGMLVFSIMELPSLLEKMAEFDCDRFVVTLLRTFPADDGDPFACIVNPINGGA